MANLNPNEAVVAVTGAIISMPVDTVLEYDNIYDLPTGATEHGYASDEGITLSNSTSTTNIMGWQNSALLRVVTTEASATFQFTLVQTNDDNLELWVGKVKNAVTGGYHFDAGHSGGRRAWLFDVIDENTNTKIRYYVPSGEITERGEQNLTSGGLLSYTFTITAYRVDVAGEQANTVFWKGPATKPVTP